MRQLIEEIDHTITGLTWRLWNTLGVAGEGFQEQKWFISLEELIILTAVIAESDPRLRDEALDWCSKFHSFVSISRLRTLVKELGAQIYIPFSTFAETLNAISKSNWPIFTKVSPLRIVCSKKSHPPNCEIPALLGLRLRALFGVGARADLALSFLIKESKSFTAADMVEIGYNKRTLADALDNFVQSGLLSCSMSRNQKKYELAKNEQLARLAGELPDVIPDWRSVLLIFITLRTAIFETQNSSISSKIVAARNALKHLTNQLSEFNISPPQLPPDTQRSWDLFVSWVTDTIKALAIGTYFKKVAPKVDNLEKNVLEFMQNLYRVDDCIDGLDSIISSATENPTTHQKIFKECYQIGICYLKELQVNLDILLTFPNYLLRDEKLSAILYKYSQENLKSFLAFVKKSPKTNAISHAGIAFNWYKDLEEVLNELHRLIFTIKARVKELYFSQTDIHLLTNAPILYKRHAVIDLFADK